MFALREEYSTLTEESQQLKARIAWFEKQLFGRKSEKRVIENPYQDDFLTPPTTTPAEPEVKVAVSYERGTAKKVRPDDCATDAGLRFSDEVPVEIIRITPPELIGEGANDYEIVDTKISRKLAQQPASYLVLQYETPVIKHKATQAITPTPMPAKCWIAALPMSVYSLVCWSINFSILATVSPTYHIGPQELDVLLDGIRR